MSERLVLCLVAIFAVTIIAVVSIGTLTDKMPTLSEQANEACYPFSVQTLDDEARTYTCGRQEQE